MSIVDRKTFKDTPQVKNVYAWDFFWLSGLLGGGGGQIEADW